MADFDFTSAPVKSRQSLLKAGVRIDMTPMVDVIMLLLTFFMLTTTLANQQVMKINLPKGDESVPVNMGNVLTVRVSEKGNTFFSFGKENGSESLPEKIRSNEIGSRLAKLSAANSDLLLILKFDRNMKYRTMVDMLDEINNSIPEKSRRLSIKKMESTDVEIIKKAGD